MRKLLIASSFGIPLAYFCYSWASQLWHFYLIAFLEGLFTNGISFLTVGTVVNNWFESKRAVATGLAFAGSGLGGAVFMPVVSAVIEAWGWRWAYRMTAAAGLALLLPALNDKRRDGFHICRIGSSPGDFSFMRKNPLIKPGLRSAAKYRMMGTADVPEIAGGGAEIEYPGGSHRNV